MSGVLIISKDEDFSSVVAEHLREELSIEVAVAESLQKAKSLIEKAQLMLATETLPEKLPLPAMVISPPVRLNDVLAKVKARLMQELPEHGVALGSKHQFYVQQKMVTQPASKKTIDLTDKETQILSALLSAGKMVSKEKLLKEIWGVVSELESHTLETHVYRLRAKLKELGLENTITAVPGGYEMHIES